MITITNPFNNNLECLEMIVNKIKDLHWLHLTKTTPNHCFKKLKINYIRKKCKIESHPVLKHKFMVDTSSLWRSDRKIFLITSGISMSIPPVPPNYKSGDIWFHGEHSINETISNMCKDHLHKSTALNLFEPQTYMNRFNFKKKQKT